MVRTVGSLFLLSVLFGSTQANASISAPPSTIDFSGIGLLGNHGSTLMLTVDGVDVTFSSTVDLIVDDLSGERVLHSLGFQTPITVTFGGGFTAAFVEIEIPLFFGDIVMGEAFDASNVSLGSGTTTLLDGVLHLDGPGIASVVYDDVVAQGISGYVLDRFTFAAVIPEPSSLLIASFLLAISARMPRSLRRR